VIIRQLTRASICAAAQDGGSGGSVITANGIGPRGRPLGTRRGGEPIQLELSCRTDDDGTQVISVTGELDIATAEQAYTYVSEVIDCWEGPVTVDLAGVTFCDASGLRALARIARHAREADRQLRLRSARPSVLKIMRITGLDRTFPELSPSALAY
jgi:anti-sigma B factor antagonist